MASGATTAFHYAECNRFNNMTNYPPYVLQQALTGLRLGMGPVGHCCWVPPFKIGGLKAKAPAQLNRAVCFSGSTVWVP